MNFANRNSYLLPLWTGILINEFFNLYPKYPSKPRLTNNQVENSFKILKNHLLNGEKVLPSTLSAILYRKAEAQYFEFYAQKESDICNPVKLNKKQSKTCSKDKLLSLEKEKWNKKKQTIRREKGIFYKSNSNFALSAESAADVELSGRSESFIRTLRIQNEVLNNSSNFF